MGAGTGKRRWLGVCQSAILRRVRGAEFVGTVRELADLVGHPEKRTWLAIVGLAERRLILAQRSGRTLRLSITGGGRRVGGH